MSFAKWRLFLSGFRWVKWWHVRECDRWNKYIIWSIFHLNTLRLRQNGHHFPDDIVKSIFLNENVLISTKIPLKFIPKSPINNIPALVQIMVCRWPGDKQLSEPMMVDLPTHICVTRPQWVNKYYARFYYVCAIVGTKTVALRKMEYLQWKAASHVTHHDNDHSSRIDLRRLDIDLTRKCQTDI